MEEIVAYLRPTMNATELTVVRAQLANLESIRRRFRAIWVTKGIRFAHSKHIEEVAVEFLMHENWLVSLGLMQEDDKQLSGVSGHLVRDHCHAGDHIFQTPFKVVTDENGMKVISLFLPRLVGDVGFKEAQWFKLREEEERFACCCVMLQRYVQIASEGGLRWEDLISTESVATQLLRKDEKVRFGVPPKEVFITRFQTQEDVSGVQLNCGWSSTVPAEEMNFVVDISGTGSVVEDLFIGSFKPFSIVIWNVRNVHRDSFADAVQDFCARNLADVLFLFNTRLTYDGAVQGILDRLPYDTHYSMAQQDLRGGSTVLWNSSRVNLLCGGWKFGGDFNCWVSVLSQLDQGSL